MEDTKLCPYCDEVIKINAIKCKHCGSLLTDTKVPTGEITPEDQVKSALGNKYEILEELGRGGMATVYKAKQLNLNRLVALKVIHKNLINYRDREFLERFQREAQLSASLNHSNIVRIYDVGSEGVVNYISMEYLEGLDLHHVIRNQGKLSIQDTVNIIAPIAEALDYAHNKGIVHRDIKSSNIILTSGSHAVLTDFGIAHAATDTKLTQTGMIIGTPEYMSPEQAISGNVDAQSDLYSLGVVMYECLTGDVPFRGETPVSTIYKIVNEKVESLTKSIPGTPGWLDSIVNKILAKDKKKRFASGKEFSRALRAKTTQEIEISPDDKTVVITKNESKNAGSDSKNSKPRKIIFALAIGLILFVSLGYILYSRGLLTFLNGNSSGNSLSELERKRIELLLEEGEQLMQSKNFITPEGNNAAEKYSEVLKINPGNQYSKERINQISSIFEKEVNKLISHGDFPKAEELLANLLRYFPENNYFRNSSNEIKIKRLETRAGGLLNTDPMEAYEICQEIKKLDPSNGFIASSYPVIKKNLLSDADKEFKRRNYNAALNGYNRIITFFGGDNNIEQKIAQSNSEIKKSRIAEEETGKKTVLVPNLIGLSLREAENSLLRKGLLKGKTTEVISDKNKGKIINQIPKAGTSTEKSTVVRLFIGK